MRLETKRCCALWPRVERRASSPATSLHAQRPIFCHRRPRCYRASVIEWALRALAVAGGDASAPLAALHSRRSALG